MTFLTALTIVFVVFKLLGKLDWSWFVVLFPALLLPASMLLLYIGSIVWGFIGQLFGKYVKSKRWTYFKKRGN